jgi:hypothetical protein
MYTVTIYWNDKQTDTSTQSIRLTNISEEEVHNFVRFLTTHIDSYESIFISKHVAESK